MKKIKKVRKKRWKLNIVKRIITMGKDYPPRSFATNVKKLTERKALKKVIFPF